ncbi:MAG: ATP-binding cassette domain-containing protein [Actinomycetia bacterium]|nr:ATP-binding cassette domain-containing protein [Actinomycetes bacterium]
MLRAAGIWLRHDRQAPWVLRGADLTVEPGQVVGLWGPSGIGKSTLGSVVAGMLRPERGSVTVDGRPLAEVRGPRPVQLVGQRPELMMDPRWRIGRILAEAGAPADDDHGLVEPAWLERFPHELSSGELQRVNLARALRAAPAYLIADEISVSLDAITQARIWREILARVRADGLGVLAITHDPDLLAAVADHPLALHAGRTFRPDAATFSLRTLPLCPEAEGSVRK